MLQFKSKITVTALKLIHMELHQKSQISEFSCKKDIFANN